jgi:hypothetical protein
MKKLVTILSSLLFMLGLKAQTPVTVKKETAPQVKPTRSLLDSASIKPVKDMHIKKTEGIFKNSTIADSMRAHEGIKGATIKQVPIKDPQAIKFDKTQTPMKEVPIKK